MTEYRNVAVSITLSKELCVEVPEGTTEEDIIKKAKLEILTPDKLLQHTQHLLSAQGIRAPQLDFKGWTVDELEYVVGNHGKCD